MGHPLHSPIVITPLIVTKIGDFISLKNENLNFNISNKLPQNIAVVCFSGKESNSEINISQKLFSDFGSVIGKNLALCEKQNNSVED